eukprot:ctg_3726.g508
MGTGGETVEESAGAGVTGGAGRIALTASPSAHADAVADKVGSVPDATPVLSGAAGRRVGRSAGGCRGCHCKNSRCLKLYCDCFAAGVYCTDCYCANCLNRPEYENARQRAIRTTLLRNPLAFHAKVVLGEADGGENDRAVVRDRLPSAMAAPPGTGPPEHLVTSAAGGDGPAAEASSPPTPPLDRTMSAVATPDGRLVPMLCVPQKVLRMFRESRGLQRRVSLRELQELRRQRGTGGGAGAPGVGGDGHLVFAPAWRQRHAHQELPERHSGRHRGGRHRDAAPGRRRAD